MEVKWRYNYFKLSTYCNFLFVSVSLFYCINKLLWIITSQQSLYIFGKELWYQTDFLNETTADNVFWHLFRQSLTVTHLKITLVLGVSCLEEVQTLEKNHKNLSSLVKSRQQVTNILYTCPCSCLEGNCFKMSLSLRYLLLVSLVELCRFYEKSLLLFSEIFLNVFFLWVWFNLFYI